jgi:hypothetical protein
MPEITQPEHQAEQRDSTEPQQPDIQVDPQATGGQDAPPDASLGDDTTASDGGGEDTGDASGSELPTETVTTYERTVEGHRVHRVTRRTVQRKEITEDTQETVTETETYPVGYPVPYQPPSSSHPAPVG